MSSDRYKCAKCHYFFHELDMTKIDDGRLMCGDCATIECAGLAQANEPIKRWICSQCKYESSWQFARCGSCGCHGSCMDKKLPEPKEEVASSYFDPMDVAGLCPSRLGINAPSDTSDTGYRLCCACGKTVLVSGLLYMDASNPYMCIDCCNKADQPVRNAASEPDNSHYTKGGIEPWTYIQANSLNFFEGSVVKYITRWRHKNGIEDLRKARVYIDELIRQEESK